MTRKEAIQALREGKKVIHRYFTHGEFIIYRFNHIFDEEGRSLGTIEDFMSYRQGEKFEIDWDILP